MVLSNLFNLETAPVAPVGARVPRSRHFLHGGQAFQANWLVAKDNLS